MSDIPTREAELIARHAARDAYADSIASSAQARLSISTFDVIEPSTQQIAITDAATVTLTVPATAVGATVQAVLAASGEQVKFTVDGTSTPDDVTGFAIEHLGSVDLGKTPEAPGGDPDELANFLAIAVTGVTGYLRVVYYEPK